MLSDPASKDLPPARRLAYVTVASIGHPEGGLKNIPPAKGIEEDIELRLNNIPLDRPSVDAGWLVFPARPKQFAVGNNLLGIRVKDRSPDASEEISIEKLEVHVDYRDEGERQ